MVIGLGQHRSFPRRLIIGMKTAADIMPITTEVCIQSQTDGHGFDKFAAYYLPNDEVSCGFLSAEFAKAHESI